jgi:WS/DGAT/MGAT family acyltransferase
MLKQHQQMLEADTQYTESELRRVAESLKAQFDSGVHLLGALRRVVGAWAGKGDALKVPWLEVPHTSINTPVVDGARRFVAQSWPFARIRAVGKALDGTFNDAVLAMCAGALRRQLQNHGELPSKSLKAMVPVSLRRAGDVDSANAVGTISADLATNIKDPVKRFVAIQKSMAAGKDLFSQLAPREAALLTQLTVLPGLVLLPLGLLGRFPPFSTVISNVPGPRQPMYWNGAKLKGIYPASIVTDGVALNITLVSCHDQVDFGITACRRSMPQAQRFIDYLDESLVELEEAVGLAKSAEPTRRASSSSAKRKAPVSARSKASASGASKAVRKAKLKPRSAAAKKSTADAKAKAPAKAKAASKTKVAAKPKAKAQAKARTKARAPAAVAKTDG